MNYRTPRATLDVDRKAGVAIAQAQFANSDDDDAWAATRSDPPPQGRLGVNLTVPQQIHDDAAEVYRAAAG
jgi:hypothetical protein